MYETDHQLFIWFMYKTDHQLFIWFMYKTDHQLFIWFMMLQSRVRIFAECSLIVVLNKKKNFANFWKLSLLNRYVKAGFHFSKFGRANWCDRML